MSVYELYQSYRKGWVDAAKSNAKDQKYVEHLTMPVLKAEYELGYADGRKNLARVMADASKRLGYEPNPLRGTRIGI